MKPKISVVIPTYNEEKHIEECLDSILNQDYKDYEVIVVDGSSTDKTREIVKKYHIKLLNNPKKITPCGLNIGIKQAKGKYILLGGAHTIVPNDFISKNLREFANKDIVCIGGEHKIRYENKISKIIGIVIHSRFAGGRSFYKRKAGFVDTVSYGFYDAKILKKNLLDENLIVGSDNELNFRLINQGYKIYYDPEIRSYYYSRSTFVKFIKQMFDYGVAKAKLINKDRRNFRASFLIPSLFLIYLTSLLFNNPLLYRLPLVLFLSISLIFSIKEASEYKEIWSIPLLFILFFVLYISLGIGFFKGVIR